MTIDLQNYPQVPPTTNSLSPKDLQSYVTNVSNANFAVVKAAVEALEATVLAKPDHTRSAGIPDTGKVGDRWVDTSANEQEKICVNPYTSGNGLIGDWVSLRDSATLTIANSAATTAAEAKATSASDFPSDYTQDWIFVNSGTGAMYLCTETYTSAFTGDRSTKYVALTDAAATTALGNVQASLDNLADDGVITSSEKNVLDREWKQIQDNKTLMDSLATSLALTGDAAYVAAVAAYDALNTYLNTTLTLFSVMTSDTSLTGASSTRTEWNNKWKGWYSALTTFSNTSKTALDQSIDNVQSDETITQSESRDYKVRWDYEVQNYTHHGAVTDTLEASGFIDKGSDATWLAYVAAYDDLNTYLNVTLGLFVNSTWPLLLSTKSSSATEWKTKWKALTDSERNVSQLTNNTLASQIDSLADDGVISKGGEKILATQGWKAIYGTDGSDGEYALAISRANALISAGNTGITGDRDSLTNAYTALNTYLTTTLTSFLDTTVDTAVTNAVWDSTWNLYFLKYAALDKASSDIADVNVGLVSGLVNDSAITVGKEKQELIEWFDGITREKDQMLVRATIGVGATTTNYVAAYDALQSYLYGLFTGGNEAAFLDSNIGSTSINRSVWKQKFDDYYDERELLQTAIVNNNISNLTKDSAAIPNMATDGEITSEEKYTAKVYWNVIFGDDATPDDNGEHNALTTHATNLGVTASYITDLTNAFTQLRNLLTDDSHGVPNSETTALTLFTDMESSQTLTAAQQTYWQTYWANYYAKRDVLITQSQAMISGGLSGALKSDGSVAMTADFNFGNFKGINVADGTITSGGKEAVNGGQLDTVQTTANTAVSDAATAQSTADTAVTNAATAQSTADTATTNAATAQSTADTAQTTANTANTSVSEVKASIAQDPQNIPFRYVAVAASGTGDGSSSANRMAEGDVRAFIDANAAVVLFLEGDTGYGDLFGVATEIVGKVLYIVSEGNVTCGGITLSNSAVFVGSTGGVITFASAAVTYSSLMRGMIAATIDGNNVVEGVATFTGLLFVVIQSVVQLNSLSTGDLRIYSTSYVRYSNSGTMNITGDLEIEEHSFLRAQGDVNITGTGVVSHQSFTRVMGSFTGTTPTASSGGANY